MNQIKTRCFVQRNKKFINIETKYKLYKNTINIIKYFVLVLFYSVFKEQMCFVLIKMVLCIATINNSTSCPRK